MSEPGGRMCGCGEGPAREPHPCPYEEELRRDSEAECTCCEHCIRRCMEQI